jgi:hypothetical protein
MAGTRRYDQELRAVGQALVAKGITAFELKHVPAGYFIQDLHERTPSFRRILGNWLHRATGRPGAEAVTLGSADVQQLDEAGRARRSKPGQLTDFRDLSNILRTIGAYLDTKEVELLELHKRPISVTLAYRDKSGHEEKEDRPISSFYNLFLELYGKRGQIVETLRKAD